VIFVLQFFQEAQQFFQEKRYAFQQKKMNEKYLSMADEENSLASLLKEQREAHFRVVRELFCVGGRKNWSTAI
jgi:hypothetical protein